jgi:hypothetical protein
MHTHNFLVNQGNEWHMIEALEKLLPKCDFVPPLDFVKESIDSCDGLALVVSPQDDDLTRVSNFQSE